MLAAVQFEQVDPGIARDLKYLEAGLSAKGFTLIWHVGWHTMPESTHPSTNLTPRVIISYVDEHDPAVATFLQQFGVPILPMSTAVSGQPVGRAQATYLANATSKYIVFANTEQDDVQQLAQARLDGVRQGCANFGLEPPLVQVIPASREGARAAPTC